MRTADRLSERHFRICSWNYASANTQGAVLEMVYIKIIMHSTGDCWDILEEKEEDLGDTIMTCCDFNAQSC